MLETRALLAGTPIISEFLAANSGGLEDSDGESSDWIELYNPTATAVDLAGWSLTDSAGDLNQWIFPSVTIGANQFLTVFASGKNRTTGAELHTNFRLSTSGEYLALVNPTGTIVSEFSPSFPAQVSNISYGVGFDTAQLITPGAAARVLVPTNGALGTTWTSPTFNAASWTSGTTGVGFGVVQPGFAVRYVKASATTTIDDLNVARDVLNDPTRQSFTEYQNVQSVNYMGNGGGGNFGGDVAFPTQTIGEDINDFIVEATGTITIPASGNWTFGVNSDDGFGLRLERNGVVFESEFVTPRGPSDTLATFNLPAAGDWNVSLIMYERGGGASVEFFAAPGSFGSFDSSFRLVGDTTSGGLVTYSAIGSGSSVVLGTNVSSAMLGINSSVYVRVPFNVTDPATFDALLLKMRYDDGFVAWLNGVEVARRNAPTTLAFNSSATADRTLHAATTPETINLTAFLSSLRTGANVLAVQTMNSSTNDDSLFMLPELTASAVHPDQRRYFETVTPGDPNRDPALGIVERVTASRPAGFYNAPITVALSSPSAGAQIRYTIDGSDPSPTNGIDYTTPIAVSSTTVLRAAAFRAGFISLASITRSYIYLDDVIVQSPSDDVAGGHPDVGAPPVGWPSTWGSNVVDYGMDQTIVQQAGATAVKDALLSIPSMSITTDLDNLFSPVDGIYSYAYNDGRDWERPASLELLNPDGSAGFQVNAGIRTRGGYSRSGDNPKHSFRFFFRGEYGDSSLDFPLFGSEGTNSYKKIDLRTAQNYSWSFGGDPSNTMIQDVFARDSQRDMGEPYTRSRPYHLYINGQYWGLFETQERAEAEFAASYFGGAAADYDVIKPEAGPYAIYATDGNLNAYQRLWQYVTTQDMSTNANYFRLQGKDANGLNDATIPNEDVLVDVDNLIVYMIGILHSGNLDAPISAFLSNQRVNNFFAIRDRTGRAGFQYFQHDGEHTLRNVGEDRNGPFPAGEQFDHFNPQYLHQKLMANAEYRLRFADLLRENFFGDGPMTIAKSQQRFLNRSDMIDPAIIAESARWGDSKRPTDPLGLANWQAAVDQVVNGFLANRNAVFLNQMVANGLFPAVIAPDFLINGVAQNSGQVTPGSLLRFAASGGLVFYTTNGEDPRLAGGGINPAALTYDPAAVTTSLFSSGSSWKYFDLGTDLGTAWRASAFDDAAWQSGNAELGYGDGDEARVVSFGPNAASKYITTYFRKSFNVTDASGITGLRLRLKRDDGAVVFINGVEAARSNMPTGTITSATLASGAVGGVDEQTFYEIDIPASLLVTGTNIIAVEVHQSAASSSDLSFDAELLATSQSNPGLVINSSTRIFARVLDGTWSPLSDATFSTAVAATAANLAVTEIHYNPAALAGATTSPLNDKDNFEFIELRNTGTETLTLSGVRLSTGITFDFSSGDVIFLAPGAHVVVVKNRLAFETRYGTTIPVAGVYGGNLNNGGEQVVLLDATGAVIRDFVFDDDPATTPAWPQTADGGGYSLTVRNPAGNLSQPANWRSSHLLHGTPGYEENDFPRNLALSNAFVQEQVPNRLVGVLSATDDNAADSITFSIVAGGDGAQFAIVGNELRVGPVGLSFSAGASRTVTVRATDSRGLSADQTFTISVFAVNSAPRIALTQLITTIGEFHDTTARIPVADITVTDDGIGTNALSLSGRDAGKFEIDGLRIYLRAGATLSYIPFTVTTLNCDVLVDDVSLGFGPDDTKPLTLEVTDSRPVVVQPAAPVTASRQTITWNAIDGATSYEVWVNNNTTNVRPAFNEVVTTNSWTPSEHTGIGNFTVWVRSRSASGRISTWSLPREFQVVTSVVMRPVDRYVSNPRHAVQWNAMPGAAQYEVLVDDVSRGARGFIRAFVTNATQWIASSDLPQGQMRVWVRARDAKNVAANWSLPVDFRVMTSPTITAGQNPTFDRTPTFAWNPVFGAASYSLTLRNMNNGQTVLTQTGLTATSFTVATPLPDGPYSWFVYSIGPAGYHSLTPPVQNIFIGGRPSLRLATPGARPVLSWTRVDEASQYVVQINRLGTTQTVVLRSNVTGSTTFQPASPLAAGNYRAWVRAISASGELSPWSVEVDFTVASTINQSLNEPLIPRLAVFEKVEEAEAVPVRKPEVSDAMVDYVFAHFDLEASPQALDRARAVKPDVAVSSDASASAEQG